MFSDLLRRDRERYGLRIGQAAWLLVTPADTERLEQGERWPDWTTYGRICAAVRVAAILSLASS